jgi:hypothetical protein
MLETQLIGLLVAEIAVLGCRAIREYLHIAQLLGICWDVSPDDDKPWPVLVFEESKLGNLHSYCWRPLRRTFTDNLRFCVDIGTSIAAMHSNGAYICLWYKA